MNGSLPTSSQVIDEKGMMSLAWRSYFDSKDQNSSPRGNQETPAGGQISLANRDFQIVPLEPAGAVTTDNIAFKGTVPDGARIILVCLQNSVTIKDNDSDGGCALGADLALAAKRAAQFIYMAEIKRFMRV